QARAARRLHRDDPRAAERADPSADRAHVGRRVLHRLERQAAERGLRPAPLAPRPQEGDARDDRCLRRRRGNPAAGGRRTVRALVQEGPVKRALLLVAVVASALAAGVDGAGATDECRGTMACLPVAGPWVVVPAARQTPRPEVQYQLKCRKGFIVAGTDAEVTDQGIDLWFLGASGAPVGPGTTTSQTMVFVARYVGSSKQPQTFRPHIGCVPA